MAENRPIPAFHSFDADELSHLSDLPMTGLRSRTRTAGGYSTAAGVVVAVILGLAAQLSQSTTEAGAAQISGDETGCPPERLLSTTPTEMREAMADQPRVVITKSTPFDIEFRRSREVMTDTRLLDVPTGEVPEGVVLEDGASVFAQAGEFVLEGSSTVFPIDQLTVNATWNALRTGIEIDFCVDPSQPRSVDPGTYFGAVSVVDARFTSLAIPSKITLQSTSKIKAWFSVIVGGVAGGFWGVVSSISVSRSEESAKRQQQPVADKPHHVAANDDDADQKPPIMLLLILGVCAGIVAGVLTWVNSYDADPGFSANDWSGWTRLGGVALVSGMSSYAVVVVLAMVTASVGRQWKRPRA